MSPPDDQMAAINALSERAFVARFGAVFEHSSWIMEAVAERRPFADLAAMEAAMRAVIDAAGGAAQIALIQAHPELAGKAAIDRALTAASACEQASAGLDRMTHVEFERFHVLNAAYFARFGFPFIICVRLTDRAGILAAMEARAHNARADEIATALAEIGKIAHLRLIDLLDRRAA